MTEAISILRTRSRARDLANNAISVLMGAGFTFCLFMGIAHYENVAPAGPPPEIVDLRAVAIPLEPPPPPRDERTESEPSEVVTTVTGFDLAPSDSPVKIAVSPPMFDALSPAAQLAPPAMIQVGQLYGDFRPKTDASFDSQHIFQQSEVDRIPTVLFRKDPVVPNNVRHDVVSLRVKLLLVIDANGLAGDIRILRTSGNPAFDAIIIENIKEWGFSPAIKKGRKVKCLVEQAVTVRWAAGSPFEV
jgi:TonB family protein